MNRLFFSSLSDPEFSGASYLAEGPMLAGGLFPGEKELLEVGETPEDLITDETDHIAGGPHEISGGEVVWGELFETEQQGSGLSERDWEDDGPLNREVPAFENAFSASLLPAKENKLATGKNRLQVQKAALSLQDILSVLGKTISLEGIRRIQESYNQKHPGEGYETGSSNTPDAVFTEALHQFQIANFIHPKEHDGILGPSTLDTLGFVNHGLKLKLDSRGFYGQEQLNRRDIQPLIPAATGQEFSASNWFQYIVRPSWLGVKIASGVHVLLLRKLREAEIWLLQQQQYKGMTSAALGRALGFNADTAFSAARLSADNQAMHGFGLAIDINVAGNPWIGAGWIQPDNKLVQERTRMIQALRKASGDTSLPGETVFAYLDHIARSAGNDTMQVYKILKQKNDEFIAYLKKTPEELSYWTSSYTFGGRNPLKGFLDLHPDLVYALRQVVGLAWGAVDFGPRASGDIMHFDLRTTGLGKIICEKIGGYIPKTGHPVLNKEADFEEEEYGSLNEQYADGNFHEAIGEAEWENKDPEKDLESRYEEVFEE
jgi:hypothetical protein